LTDLSTQYLLPKKNINCEAEVCKVNLEISGVWLDEKSDYSNLKKN